MAGIPTEMGSSDNYSCEAGRGAMIDRSSGQTRTKIGEIVNTNIFMVCDEAFLPWSKDKNATKTAQDTWQQPVLWNEHAAQINTRYRVLILRDVFDDIASKGWQNDLFTLIALTPHLDWILLSKHLERMGEYIGGMKPGANPLKNLWIGFPVSTQEEADRDVPKLLKIPAAKLFLSIEPCLEPMDISKWLRPRQTDNPDGYGGDIPVGWTTDFSTLDWVIVSGGRKPLHPNWVRSIRDQCQTEKVPFLFTSWGDFIPVFVNRADARAD
jgi:protein gp37